MEHIEFSWWQGLVLGLVQGLTEYIPVSSTAHLRIVPALVGWPDPGAAFSAVLQLGTLLAVLTFFARDISQLALGSVLGFFSRRWQQPWRLAWQIALANVPIVVLGLLARDFIEHEARSLTLIAIMLATVALALIAAERLARQHKTIEKLRRWEIFAIGCFQALALLPGSSRSGTTILGGLLIGLKRAEAARFSFLLGVPAIFGSAMLQLPHVFQQQDLLAPLLWGLLSATLAGYASIAFLLRFLEKHPTHVFALYRLGLAAFLLSSSWK